MGNKIEIFLGLDLNVTNKHSGKKKHNYVVKEFKSGFDKSHKLGKDVFKSRLIDRRGNHYFEEVVDVDNDEVMHQCSEPLSEHYGHGSAKKKDN